MKRDVIEVRNPYNGEIIGDVPLCDANDVDSACRTAAAALARDDFPRHARARVLERATELLRGRVHEFGELIAAESGKPIRTATAEALRAVDTLTFSAATARTFTGEMIPMEASGVGEGKIGFVMRVPIGVVAAISPFNFPLNLVAHKVGPAIAAGCPVVLKPASVTPLSGIALVELLIEAGLPPDWITVVTGPGGTVGSALVDHPVPALISFTGSPAVGWQIRARAPHKKVSLELGSSSPVIVEPGVDLGKVAAAVRTAGFSHAGQSCISTQRILVHKDVKDELENLLAEAVDSLIVGDPLDDATDVGPLIDAAETERVLGWIRTAVAEGARLIAGGSIENGLLRPTVVADAPLDTDLCAKEVFGPVVVTIAYDTFDEAIEIANATEFGLHAGVFTNDVSKALRAARTLHFGGVLINEVPTYRADQQPYGGVKQSGNTREGPAFAVREMTELRFVML
ncbi:MAG: aldehyde dehydrogenase family protein [Gammaproteobacteria bacterium]|nr:aldehyde dehydrogenase family protein [Gammaproteobacteria bacterium]